MSSLEATSPPCPPVSTLRKFLDELLPSDERGTIDVHVSSCQICQQRLEQLVNSESGSEGQDRPPHPSDEDPPQLNGYVSLNRIDAGGMGVVWRVRDLEFQRSLAVKVLKARARGDASAVHRFFEEARITSQLAHPFIVPIHTMGRLADGRPYYTMKLVEGETLAKQLHDPPAQVSRRMEFVQKFGQICQALAFAHSRGILHRDLKPANIMVGQHGEVQVMDWGLTKVLPDAATRHGEMIDANATIDGTRPETRDRRLTDSPLGTWAWMPPEQANARVNEVDRRSDVFGLGAILCEVLTGDPPYRGPNVRRQAEEADLADALDRLRGCGADPELMHLAERCLAPSKSDRPADAGEVATAVAAYQAAVQERLQQERLERERQQVTATEERKRRRVLTIAGWVLAAGIVGTTTGFVRERNAKHVAEKAEDDTLAEFRAGTNDVIEQLIGSKPLGPQETKYLEQTRERWQKFADRQGTDERSRAIRAEGSFRVARLWRNLWKWDESVKEYKKSRELDRQLVAEFPDAIKYKQRLAWTHNNLAGLHADAGKGDESLQEYRQARNLHRELVDQVPNEPRYQRDLANTHSALALLLTRFGQPDEAVQEFEQTFVLLRKLHLDNPTTPDYRQQLADAHNKRGELFFVHLGRMVEALGEHEQAIKLTEDLIKYKDDERVYKLELADALAYRGMVLARLGRKQDAIQTYEESRKWGSPLMEAYQGIPEYKQNFARTCSSLGEALADLGMLDKALMEYEVALKHQLTLVKEYGHVPRYKEDLANTYNGLGKALFGLKRWKEARQNYEKAVELSLKLVVIAPGVSNYRVTLGESYENVGALCLEEGKAVDCRDLLDKAIKNLEIVHGKEPNHCRAKLSLRNSHWARARAYHQLEKHPEAIGDWDKVVELSPEDQKPARRANRATARLRAGQMAEAIAEVAELTKAVGTPAAPKWLAGQWYDFAHFYALASTKVPSKQREYEDRAMQMLHQAVKAGWMPEKHLAEYADLDPLREREDFKKLLAGLEAKRN